ncbi:MAG TPA: site-2 protease family protein [Blastocatellia bacterium]|nr:site-2 protease family protein [Blastocatellia bacterium]
MSVGDIILFFVVFLFSLSVHESAHAWTSERFGDDLGRSMGRITLNPIAHIDPFGTILFPLVGLLSGGFMFGWAKPVPVNPLNWVEKNKANFWVSAAGPISNFILAIIFFVLLKLAFVTGLFNTGNALGPYEIWVPIRTLLLMAVQLNIVLAIFNLIPIPPLDGSGVLESILPDDAQRGYEQIKPYGWILLIALLVSGVLGYIIGPILAVVRYLLMV